MLFTIASISGSQLETITARLTKESHWLHRYEQPGHWHGTGAKMLGLQGAVQSPALRQVLQGMTPDGKVRLAHDALEPNRHCGWLLRFQSPASVNAFHGVAPTKHARALEKDHEAAVKDVLGELEKQVQEAEGTSLVSAVFQHRTGHGQTPGLHTLVAVSNMGMAENGQVRMLSASVLKLHHQSASEVYFDSYVQALEKRFHVEVKTNLKDFRLPGVPKEACQELSRTFGVDRGPVVKMAHLLNRQPAPCWSELQKHWNEIGLKTGWNTGKAKELALYGEKQNRQFNQENNQEKSTKRQGHSH